MLKLAYIKKIGGAIWLILSILCGSVHVFTPSHNTVSETTQQKTSTSDSSAEKQELSGNVEVSFKIGADGKADIIEIKSENPALIEYVKTKLSKIQLKKDDFNIDEVITYRFRFGKEA